MNFMLCIYTPQEMYSFSYTSSIQGYSKILSSVYMKLYCEKLHKTSWY